jgi:hypothetical protein
MIIKKSYNFFSDFGLKNISNSLIYLTNLNKLNLNLTYYLLKSLKSYNKFNLEGFENFSNSLI